MNRRIYVAGHTGMVGSAVLRQLSKQSNIDIVTATRSELNLENIYAVKSFLENTKPCQIYIAAAKVGGIYANNTFPSDFIIKNLLIQTNLIKTAFECGVKKLLFLGSSCIYPKFADQPLKEASLLTGKLESTNEPYAVAKIAGIKICESLNRQYGLDYRSIMPTNLYGENDNFHEKDSHVIPAMMRRFHEAKVNCYESVEVWGSGKPKREFLNVNDMASACIHIMNVPKEIFASKITDEMCSHVNIGTGKDISISDLAYLMAKVVGFKGKIVFNTSKPDGTPKKLLDVSLLDSLGWKYSIELEDGLRSTYEWFLSNIKIFRK